MDGTQDPIRIVIIGSNESGKSCLIQKLITGVFPTSVASGSTVTTFTKKTFSFDNKDWIIELAEVEIHATLSRITAQQQQVFKTLGKADGAMVCFNLTNSKSFFKILELKEKLDQINFKVPSMLLGTHADLDNKRQIAKDKAQRQATTWNWQYSEISAKTGSCLYDSLEELLKTVREIKAMKVAAKVEKDKFSKPKASKMKVRKHDSILKVLEFLSPDDRQAIAKDWEYKHPPPKDWSEIEPTSISGNCMLDVICKLKHGYTFELGREKIKYASSNAIEYMDSNIPYFKEDIFPRDHINYMAEVDGLGPVIVSLTQTLPAAKFKAMLRTKFGCDRFFVPSNLTPIETLRHIKSNHPRLQGVSKDQYKTKFTQVNDSQLSSDLVDIEMKEIVKRYKIGLLYVKDGQTNEDDMLSNVTTSNEFEEFLNFIGNKVLLKGWSNYAGGLDTKSDSTGTHSLYTTYEGIEIMFHVSTLLPFQENDKQRVERKRHIGNDVVVLVFKDGNHTFDPRCLTSQFNHVFIVVEAEKSPTGKTLYRVNIANKPGVNPYQPFLTSPPIFEKGIDFKNFLLAKLINGERGAMFSPEFRGKMTATKRTQLEMLLDKYVKNPGKSRIRSPSVNPTSPSVQRRTLESESYNSTNSYGSDSDTEIENVVGIGRNLFALSLKDPKTFNIDAFKELLHQLMYWTISNDNSFGTSKQQNSMIEYAKAVVKAGKAVVEVQESRKISKVEEERFEQLHEQLRRSLSTFFLKLKESKNTPSNSNASSPVVNNLRVNVDRMKSKSQDVIPFPHLDHLQQPKRGDSVPSFAEEKVLDDEFSKTIKETNKLMEKVSACLAEKQFNQDAFVQLMSELIKMTKEVAMNIEESKSKQLVGAAKLLLLKGQLLKTSGSSSPVPIEESKSQALHALSNLKSVFREHTGNYLG